MLLHVPLQAMRRFVLALRKEKSLSFISLLLVSIVIMNPRQASDCVVGAVLLSRYSVCRACTDQIIFPITRLSRSINNPSCTWALGNDQVKLKPALRRLVPMNHGHHPQLAAMPTCDHVPRSRPKLRASFHHAQKDICLLHPVYSGEPVKAVI